MTTEAYIKSLRTKVAALDEVTKSTLSAYWDSLWGDEMASDIVKDFKNDGKSIKVEASIDSELMTKIAALTPESIKALHDMWDNLLGSEYASDMVEDYKGDGKKKNVEASTDKIVTTAIIRRLAKMSTDDKKEIEAWLAEVYGDEYAADATKDYSAEV